jgi:hypothetical protein
MDHSINLLQKNIRGKVIAEHLRKLGKNNCVCFTCGNAGKALREQGLGVIEINQPERWYSFAEIGKQYSGFDATSGHLPIPLMAIIANELKKELKTIPEEFELPTGSGETFVCLKMAFPFAKITPVYNLDKSTEFHELAPLNDLVDAIYQNGKTIFSIRAAAKKKQKVTFG